MNVLTSLNIKRWDSFRLILLFVSLSLFGLIQSAYAGSGVVATITLTQQSIVESHTYCLGQISQIATNDLELKERLNRFELGTSPLPGQSLFVQQGVIEQKLKQIGIEQSQCRIVSHGPVKVLRKFNIADSNEISEAVRSFVEKNAPWNSTQMKIRPIKYNQNHRLASGKITFQVDPPKYTDWIGAESFAVTALVDGQVHKKFNVPVFIEVWNDVVISTKPLGRGQPIESDDIKIEKMNLARVPADAIVQMDQLVGKRTKRTIAVNTILRNDQFEQPPVIRKGDIVQVLAESQNMQISTQAIARDDGGKGERISLTNIASKKTIYALVFDHQTAKVQFTNGVTKENPQEENAHD